MLKGIDVSSHNGEINWNIVKSQIDFAIIRLGYGDNVERQDDSYFIKNVNGCIDNGIPFGVYIYSYALNLGGNESIQSEIEHTKRMLSKISQKPFCVYIDMEDDSTIKLGKSQLTNFALEYCKQITSLGYKAGVYANENWFKNYLQVSTIASYGYSIWCAKYSSNKPNITSNYDVWQYTSEGRLNGINTVVDMNNMYNNIIDYKPTPQQFEITYQVWEDIKNKWLPDVVNDTDYAGRYGSDVCCIYANANIGNVYYKVSHVNYKQNSEGKWVYSNSRWLPEVKNRTDYAGLYNKPIDGFMIKSDTKPLTYRVHLRNKNRWLPWVTGYSTSDSNNGYAGIIGQEIDAIQIK